MEPGIDFPRSLRKTPLRHAARYRVLRSANCTGCTCGRAKAGLVDFGQLAGPGPLRLHALVAGADVHRGTGRLECGGYLSLRRRFWRDGTPLAGNDSSVRRSCAL